MEWTFVKNRRRLMPPVQNVKILTGDDAYRLQCKFGVKNLAETLMSEYSRYLQRTGWVFCEVIYSDAPRCSKTPYRVIQISDNCCAIFVRMGTSSPIHNNTIQIEPLTENQYESLADHTPGELAIFKSNKK